MEVCEKKLFPTPPPPMNRLYYPIDVDVRNHMYQASVKEMLYVFDQQNVENWKMDNWKLISGESLRPYLDPVHYLLYLLLLKFRKMKQMKIV